MLVAVPGIWLMSGRDNGKKSAEEARDRAGAMRATAMSEENGPASPRALAENAIASRAELGPRPTAASNPAESEPAEAQKTEEKAGDEDETGAGAENAEPQSGETDDLAASDLHRSDGSLERGASTAENKRRRIARARKLVQQASRFRRGNRLGMAEAYYLKALEIWRRYPRAVAGMVRVHLQRRDGAEAVRWAKKLVTIQPRRSNNQLLLGDAYQLRGNLTKAKRAWRRSATYGNRIARRRLRKNR